MAFVAFTRLDHMTAIVLGEDLNTYGMQLTVGGNHSSTPREPLIAVNQHHSSTSKRLINPLARSREVDQQVGVVEIGNGDAHVCKS